MNNSSKSILEAMLYRVPNLRFIYHLLDLEAISSSEHPEMRNITSHFKHPSIILAIGVITHCLIIERTAKNMYHVVDIGNEVIYYKCGRGEIFNICDETIKLKAFMPEPLSKKIVLITEYDSKEYEGIIYTQYFKDGHTGFIMGNCKYGSTIDNYELAEKNTYSIVTKFLRALEVREYLS